MTDKINQIQDRVAYALEHVVLNADWFPARKLIRHKGPLPLEQTESLLRFRAFSVEIEGGGEGTNTDDETNAWYNDVLVITVGYPDNIQVPNDTYFRGISGMAASDKKRITSMVARYEIFELIASGHPAYDGSIGNLSSLGNVHIPILLGWSFNGKVSKIRYQLEYAETDE